MGHLLVRLLAPLTRWLAPDCSLRSRPPLRSLVHSLAHFAYSLARGTVKDWMAILSVFFSIFDHSVRRICFSFQASDGENSVIDLNQMTKILKNRKELMDGIRWAHFFTCVLASLQNGPSVRLSFPPSVRPLVFPSIRMPSGWYIFF